MRLKTIDESIGEANTKDQVLKDFIEDWDVACSDSEDIEYAQEAVLKTYKSNFPEVFKNEIAEYLNKWRKQYSGNIDEAVDPVKLLADIKKITSAWTYGKVRIKHVSGQKNLLYIDLVMPEGNRVDHVAKNAGAKLAVKINDLLLSKGIDLEDFSHQMSGPVYNIFAVSDAFTDLPI